MKSASTRHRHDKRHRGVPFASAGSGSCDRRSTRGTTSPVDASSSERVPSEREGARSPATRVAHAFRAGDDGLALLAFGTRDPNDIVYYPRSGKVSLRGVGVQFRVDPLDYWDGEPG
jgi:hypothetical protein